MSLAENTAHSNEAQCAELVKHFGRIDDPAVREKVLELVQDLATNTGELLTIDDLIVTPQSS